MGAVFADITLKNVSDETKSELGLIKKDEIRSITVKAVVDTGASAVVINEELRQKLGLEKMEERWYRLADGKRIPGWRTEQPVRIHWKDRSCTIQAVVIPGADKVLLGFIPLEDMDLIVNPKTQEVVGAHGDEQLYWLL